MKPFKFLNNKIYRASELASWDFYQDYNELIGDHRIEIEWYSSFMEFLSRFDCNGYVLIDEIRIPFDENSTYQDINHYNWDSWVDEFTNHTGRVRITWLNFDTI